MARKPHPGKDPVRAQRVIELRRQGMMYKQIMHETGLTMGSVCYLLKTRGLTKPHQVQALAETRGRDVC